ncbi:hypothetical protein EYZ11_010482 [Aspergillus tanneri]|uniref:Uncharacterized protein n=1 Tax=Aspergillus tanneri TaxID=1220188 RepID=A0A4S3J577_9EURO|nr:uncharacterized protein ATNIH1004_001524 [Aspergillus tanneri]KAA8652619.1 hypothetical protein ATNIH1004_001524 [Aspergillus tanneri]THC90066.1 hypothetical protein EYZ11_010482 [Aspergillus tanneri]
MADTWQPQSSWMSSQWYQGNHPSLPSSTFRDLVNAFPKPKQAGRVMKPRSAGNSPSNAGRRRITVSNTSPIYRHLPTQKYQASYDPAYLASAINTHTATRPISWHPASLESAAYSEHIQPTQNNLGAMGMCTQPTDVSPSMMTDGSMLPTYVSIDIPFSTETCPFSGAQYMAPMQQPSFVGMNGSQVDPVAWGTNGSSMSAATQPMSDGWAFNMMSMNSSMPSANVAGSGYASAPSSGCLTGPSTPDFLPIQQPDDNSKSFSAPAVNKPKPEEELVGMGLYNHPDSLFDTPFDSFSGKGLKLEETFTPSSDNEADDNKDAENEDDDEHVSNKKQSPAQNQKIPGSKPYKPVKPAENMMHKSFFFDDDDLDRHVMSGSQQFFNLGSQPCMNYGYGWL